MALLPAKHDSPPDASSVKSGV